MNLKNIDNWLLNNKDYSQSDRELVMKFMNEYFLSKDNAVDSSDIKSIVKNNDKWSEIIITRENPEDESFFCGIKSF